jgi:tetratricopeptide (TPR) repeat protein
MWSLNIHWQKLLLVALVSFTLPAIAADVPPEIAELRSRFDVTNFELTGKAQLEAFEKLEADAIAYTAANPGIVEGWIWSGIIRSSYAGAKGGLGALGLAKKSKADFETSMNLNAEAMQGSAFTSLGTLYYSVPGWPIGFGDDKKAQELLLAGLALNPDGIVSNYFYAQYLADEKRTAEAITYYKKALNAPPRPNRPIADAGRRKDIQAALKELGAD